MTLWVKKSDNINVDYIVYAQLYLKGKVQHYYCLIFSELKVVQFIYFC